MERTLIRSVFNQCKSKEGAGFSARYWNNTEFKGAPATTSRLTTPFRLCTSGATVFAPGVNLTDFSATYQSVFTPQETGGSTLVVSLDAKLNPFVAGMVKPHLEEAVQRLRNARGCRKIV